MRACVKTDMKKVAVVDVLTPEAGKIAVTP